MSDATNPAVVQDAQQYDWRKSVDTARNMILGRVADDLAAHIERLEAERDALRKWKHDRTNTEHVSSFFPAAERDALLAEHEAFVSDHRCGIDGLQGCDYCAAHDNAERVIRG